MSRMLIMLTLVVLVLGISYSNVEATTCLKGSGCNGGTCSWYQLCIMAPTSIAVLSNCPDPLGYEPGGAVCGRCFGLTGWGDLCGPGVAVSACF